MIAVDTSALMAILLKEPHWSACNEALDNESAIIMSAVTVFEALVVAGRRGISAQMNRLIEVAAPEVVNVTVQAAHRAAAAYGRWGKGVHPAGLNFGDCFSYEVAKQHDCALLYVGNDFVKTDIESALAVNR